MRPGAISHPDKLLYPEAGLTKADLAAYVERATPLLWPHLKDRLVSLVRCPDGAGAACFFQRHPGAGFGDHWQSQPYHGNDYIYADAPEALLAAVQMNTMEFHIWGSRRDKPEIPDRVVFDLDPDPDLDFTHVKEAARRLRDVLEALGLASLPMLSGGKGIHVIVPLRRQHDFATIKSFSAAVSQRLADDAPGRFVANMSKARRHGKIFIDYFRNDATSTAVAPFSPRARAEATVAWPCAWDELNRFTTARDMTIPRAMQALENGKSPWEGIEPQPQTIKASAMKAVGLK